jgi:hypothetical protein
MPGLTLRPSIIICLIVLVFSRSAVAGQWTPFQAAIWPPAQLFGEATPVYGLRLNLGQGRNENVWGIDAGVINTVANRQRGLQAGLLNQSEDAAGINLGMANYTKRIAGLQAGLLNAARDHAAGLQAGIILNHSDHVRGIQVHAGILGNIADQVTGGQVGLSIPLLGFNRAQDITGIQAAPLGFNHVENMAHGFQLALYNSAGQMRGIQIGLVNSSGDLSGIQIGLFNKVDRKWLPVLPFINIDTGSSEP